MSQTILQPTEPYPRKVVLGDATKVAEIDKKDRGGYLIQIFKIDDKIAVYLEYEEDMSYLVYSNPTINAVVDNLISADAIDDDLPEEDRASIKDKLD